ncbi:nitrogen regulatory protein P-II [Spirochaetia bacterium]|nr:nitrogen regulatory protein P-II [Spirochaetia bacterium]
MYDIKSRTITPADTCIRLKGLFVIADWAKIHVLSDVFSKEECLLSFVSKGDGTASSDIIDLLGVGSSEKAVFVCLVQSGQTPRIIRNVRVAMGSGTTGAGIAFTVPIEGITARIFNMFQENALVLAEKERAEIERLEKERLEKGLADKTSTLHSSEASIAQSKIPIVGDNKMMGIQIKNEMIVAILNRGNSDAFMAEARKAGARGGTVISARGISQNVMKKFFRMPVQDEKEIIFILADRSDGIDIMSAVKTDFGVESKAGGVIFSLPVDQVMSLNAL